MKLNKYQNPNSFSWFSSIDDNIWFQYTAPSCNSLHWLQEIRTLCFPWLWTTLSHHNLCYTTPKVGTVNFFQENIVSQAPALLRVTVTRWPGPDQAPWSWPVWPCHSRWCPGHCWWSRPRVADTGRRWGPGRSEGGHQPDCSWSRLCLTWTGELWSVCCTACLTWSGHHWR